MLRKLLRWGRITKSGDDTGQFPIQQTEYLGKAADAVIVLPYGFHANIPADALAMLFAIQGNPDNRAALPLSVKQRPQLAEGEVAFFHPETGSVVVWKADGSLEIETLQSVTITAPTVTINGNLVVSGTMTNAGKDVGSTHQHAQGNDSGGSTEQNIVGVL